MKIGDALNNGATVVEVATDDEGGTFVVARTHREWVTWALREDGETAHGHYFDDLEDALDDLRLRTLILGGVG